MKFDYVIGNPPYNSRKVNGKSSGNVIWDEFVKKALKQGKKIIFVHPPTWRKPTDKYSDINVWNELSPFLRYIYISSVKEGKQAFDAHTKYDWYVYDEDFTGKTKVRDINGKNEIVDLKDWNFLPNCNFSSLRFLFGGDTKQKVIFGSPYHSNTDVVSDHKTGLYTFPVVHSTAGGEPTIKYSKTNQKGHFGVPKVIIGESGVGIPILDEEGKYGMTQGGIGLYINSKEHGKKVIKALQSEAFQRILNACTWSGYRIDHKLFRNLRSDWYARII